MGLVTAIVGGFLVSALGGSRFQIGGPAGAFIVLVAATVTAHGIDGLILATLVSGVCWSRLGLLRLGAYVKFIPFPVTVGFTAGIARDHLREPAQAAARPRRLPGPEPGPLLEKLPALWAALPTLSPATCALSAACVARRWSALRRWRPHWPRMLIVVAAAAVARLGAGLPVATIGTTFGALPAACRAPRCRRSARAGRRGAAERVLLHAARGDRVAALGGGRRRHDRAAAPLEHRAGRAGRRQREYATERSR